MTFDTQKIKSRKRRKSTKRYSKYSSENSQVSQRWENRNASRILSLLFLPFQEIPIPHICSPGSELSRMRGKFLQAVGFQDVIHFRRWAAFRELLQSLRRRNVATERFPWRKPQRIQVTLFFSPSASAASPACVPARTAAFPFPCTTLCNIFRPAQRHAAFAVVQPRSAGGVSAR